MTHAAFKFALAGAALAALAALPPPAVAQGNAMPKATIDMVMAMHDGKLTVTSSAFKDGSMIPLRYTGYGANESPPLMWSKGPAGTKSYVVLTEDTGVKRPTPIYHWVLYNVPADVTQLPANMSKAAMPPMPKGAENGLNIRGASGYTGPHPPQGQSHPYHFEVFALDTTLALMPDKATHDAVVDAMKGHVLAKGEVVGMSEHKM